MAYTPEAEARIKELEEEIRKLKADNASVLVWPDLSELLHLTGLPSKDQLHTKISWISRLAVCGLASKARWSSGAYRDKMCVKYPNELSYHEVKKISECASEIVDVLLKYARQIKEEQDG